MLDVAADPEVVQDRCSRQGSEAHPVEAPARPDARGGDVLHVDLTEPGAGDEGEELLRRRQRRHDPGVVPDLHQPPLLLVGGRPPEVDVPHDESPAGGEQPVGLGQGVALVGGVGDALTGPDHVEALAGQAGVLVVALQDRHAVVEAALVHEPSGVAHLLR